MKSQVFIKYFIQHFINIYYALFKFQNIVTKFRFRHHNFISNFFIALRENETRVFFQFFIELFYDLSLVKIGCLGLIENCGFLPFFYEYSSEILKPLSNDLAMRKMVEFPFDIFLSFGRFRCDSMWLCEYNGAELNYKLFEPCEIKLLSLSFI